MKKMTGLVLMLALVIVSGALTPVDATEETLSGKLLCAKCTLKKGDAKECQDVLIVTDSAGAETEYYVVKNEVAKKAGEACTNTVDATITGTISEKDGRKWIAPSKIERG